MPSSRVSIQCLHPLVDVVGFVEGLRGLLVPDLRSSCCSRAPDLIVERSFSTFALMCSILSLFFKMLLPPPRSRPRGAAWTRSGCCSREGVVVLELLVMVDQSLVVLRDALLVLDDASSRGDGVRSLDIQGDDLARRGSSRRSACRCRLVAVVVALVVRLIVVIWMLIVVDLVVVLAHRITMPRSWSSGLAGSSSSGVCRHLHAVVGSGSVVLAMPSLSLMTALTMSMVLSPMPMTVMSLPSVVFTKSAISAPCPCP